MPPTHVPSAKQTTASVRRSSVAKLSWNTCSNRAAIGISSAGSAARRWACPVEPEDTARKSAAFRPPAAAERGQGMLLQVIGLGDQRHPVETRTVADVWAAMPSPPGGAVGRRLGGRRGRAERRLGRRPRRRRLQQVIQRRMDEVMQRRLRTARFPMIEHEAISLRRTAGAGTRPCMDTLAPGAVRETIEGGDRRLWMRLISAPGERIGKRKRAGKPGPLPSRGASCGENSGD